MSDIFVNYRSADYGLGASVIALFLAERFGWQQVFLDRESLKPAEHYPKTIRQALASTRVLVAIVGPNWLSVIDESTGAQAVERKKDWVRRELRTAFRRGVPVIPVLWTPRGSKPTMMPKPADVPTDIRRFAKLQAFHIDEERLIQDLNRLYEVLVDLLGHQNAQRHGFGAAAESPKWMSNPKLWRRWRLAPAGAVLVMTTIVATINTQPVPTSLGKELTLRNGQAVDLHTEEWKPRPDCRFAGCDVWITGTGIYGHAHRTRYSILTPPGSNALWPAAAYDACRSVDDWSSFVPRAVLIAGKQICIKGDDGAYALLTVVSTEPVQLALADVRSVTFRAIPLHG